MPTLYAGTCERCGHSGLARPQRAMSFLHPSGQLIPLPHPHERSSLLRHHHTFGLAAVRGRFVNIDARVCLDCGTECDAATIAFPASLSAFIVAAVIAAALAPARIWDALIPFASAQSWWLVLVELYVPALLGSMLLSLLASPIVRVLYRSRQLPGRSCSGCESTQTLSIGQAAGRTLPCPACGERAYVYRMTGVA